MTMHRDAIDALAQRMYDAMEQAALVPLPTDAEPGFDLDAGFAVAERIRARRIEGGAVPAGYKIGFTNRRIWPLYGVYAPIWGPVWRHTVTLLDEPQVTIDLRGLCQPRLEPEIVLGLHRTPEPGMDNAAIARCIAWAAHGFEIVHTHFADWRLKLADCMADAALHGRLYIGPRADVARFGADLAGELRALKLELLNHGEVVDRGEGSIVLDGPVDALRQWVDAMAASPAPWPIRPGDVVTTGTITDAQPMAPGQHWTTRLSDARLAGLSLRIEDRTLG
jgi:2-oxo-3-hexenedioate decarboxylase